MDALSCEREQEVLEAIKAGYWRAEGDDPLSQHVRACAVCADVLMVARFLREESRLAASEASLPDAGILFWKARLLARRAAADKAGQPVAITQSIACGSGLLAALGLGVWDWPNVQSWLSGLASLWPARDLFGSSWGFQPYLSIVVVSSSLALLSLVLYTLSAEE